VQPPALQQRHVDWSTNTAEAREAYVQLQARNFLESPKFEGTFHPIKEQLYNCLTSTGAALYEGRQTLHLEMETF
jgi:hypothetical protein